MDNQIGWIIVEFCDDGSIDVVPNFWLKNKSCAWPKASKQANKYIQKRIKPNMNDFIFFKSRQIGHKVYSSFSEAKNKLTVAMQKSDLSSADDIIDRVPRRKIKCPNRGQSLSPDTIVKSKKLKVDNSKKTKISSESCPPRYDDISHTIHSNKEKNIFDISDDSNDVVYDSDNDPLWKIDNGQRNSNNVIDGVNCLTPEKQVSLLDESIENKKHIISSPVGTWTVENFNDDTQLLYKTSSDRNSIKVKKVLFRDQCIENSGSANNDCTTVSTASTGSTVDTLTQPHDSNIIQNQPKISDDFQRFITNTLVNMKYDIGSILSVVKSNSININTLMINKNTPAKNAINLDDIFPIKSRDELESLETKMKDDENFKNTLVTQLSVLIDINDLGNSVRRIASRMFTDILLSEYSLHGFKSKLCFSSLKSYRVIIDAIRVSVKYSVVPEKEIDNSLGIWLSHAPFRIKNLSRKQEKHSKVHSSL